MTVRSTRHSVQVAVKPDNMRVTRASVQVAVSTVYVPVGGRNQQLKLVGQPGTPLITGG